MFLLATGVSDSSLEGHELLPPPPTPLSPPPPFLWPQLQTRGASAEAGRGRRYSAARRPAAAHHLRPLLHRLQPHFVTSECEFVQMDLRHLNESLAPAVAAAEAGASTPTARVRREFFKSCASFIDSLTITQNYKRCLAVIAKKQTKSIYNNKCAQAEILLF